MPTGASDRCSNPDKLMILNADFLETYRHLLVDWRNVISVYNISYILDIFPGISSFHQIHKIFEKYRHQYNFFNESTGIFCTEIGACADRPI